DDGGGHVCKADIEAKSEAPAAAAGADGIAAVAAPTVNVERAVERAVTNAVKPWKMVTVIAVLVALGLLWKVLTMNKPKTPSPKVPAAKTE
ncbi:MAG: hypothetical protein LBF41_04240, partial [Deltaproteobacteria bacterium]|nr:hypothetical protein [Deltaproteobacteria bacterium]